MLTLIIADDEKIIRDSISSLVDWESLGIQLIGVCQDGFEAYNMILDENPDIAITDIMMPGLNGIELVKQSRAMGAETEFIFLSGYQEFEFAKQAMKLEVRDYLLKPCSENEILSVLSRVKALVLERKAMTLINTENESLRTSMLSLAVKQTIIECLASQSDESMLLSDMFGKEEAYTLIHVHYLEKKYIPEFLKKADHLLLDHAKVFMYYVRNTLILILPVLTEDSCTLLCHHLGMVTYTGQAVALSCTHQTFFTMKSLLAFLLPRIRRFDKIYIVEENGNAEEICNYTLLFGSMEHLLTTLNKDFAAFQKELLRSLREFKDPELARIYSFRLFHSLQVFLSKSSPSLPFSFSAYLQSLLKLQSVEEITQFTSDAIITICLSYTTAENTYRSFIQRTIDIATEHMSDPNLSLKLIAEDYLFMNVDYVSREFCKDTGEKFSSFLTRIRMEKAKEILATSSQEKIYAISEQVGCCNPQYFSQVFKKYTGLSPSTYIESLKGDLQLWNA